MFHIGDIQGDGCDSSTMARRKRSEPLSSNLFSLWIILLRFKAIAMIFTYSERRANFGMSMCCASASDFANFYYCCCDWIVVKRHCL
jgi:hypothetical protein